MYNKSSAGPIPEKAMSKMISAEARPERMKSIGDHVGCVQLEFKISSWSQSSCLKEPRTGSKM